MFINLKKAAMFGLDCRALRKQFGELFLMSRQSEASKGASGSCGYTKRGAMFGLDARIALAIFGALSVISGAALFSAIQEAKKQQILTSVIEVAKAVEAYYLDTGIMPSVSQTNTSVLDITQLTENTDNVSNWKGPYTSLEILNTDDGSSTPSFHMYTSSSIDQTADGIPFGNATVQLRRFNHPTIADKFDYRVHVTSIPNPIADEISLNLTNKNATDATASDKAYFLDSGTTPYTHKQIYLIIMTLNN